MPIRIRMLWPFWVRYPSSSKISIKHNTSMVLEEMKMYLKEWTHLLLLAGLIKMEGTVHIPH